MADLLPAGYYTGKVAPVDGASCQFGETKTGTKQILIQFEIDEGPHAGRKVGWRGYFTENTWKRTVEALRIMGFQGDDLADAPLQPLDQRVSLTVEHESWEGKTWAKVSWVNALGGGLRLEKPLPPDELRRFSAMMKSNCSQIGVTQARKPASKDITFPPKSVTDDDLNF